MLVLIYLLPQHRRTKSEKKSSILLTWAATNMLPHTEVTCIGVNPYPSKISPISLQHWQLHNASFIVNQSLCKVLKTYMWESEKSFSKWETENQSVRVATPSLLWIEERRYACHIQLYSALEVTSASGHFVILNAPDKDFASLTTSDICILLYACLQNHSCNYLCDQHYVASLLA